MKKTTKWILGILIALVVVIAVGVVGYLAVANWKREDLRMSAHPMRLWDQERDFLPKDDGRGWLPWQKEYNLPRRDLPMRPFSGMRGMVGFSLFGFLFSGLTRLVILALVVVGIVALVKWIRRPAQPTPSPVVSPASPAEAGASNPTCPACDRSLHPDWTHCPYCGNPLT